MQVPAAAPAEILPLILPSHEPGDIPVTQSEDARLEVLQLPQLPFRYGPDGLLWIVGASAYYLLDRQSPTFVHYLNLMLDHEIPRPRDPESSIVWARLDGFEVPDWRKLQGVVTLQAVHDLDPAHVPCFPEALLEQMQIVSLHGPVMVRVSGEHVQLLHAVLPAHRFKALGWIPVWSKVSSRDALLHFRRMPNELHVPETAILDAFDEILVLPSESLVLPP